MYKTDKTVKWKQRFFSAAPSNANFELELQPVQETVQNPQQNGGKNEHNGGKNEQNGAKRTGYLVPKQGCVRKFFAMVWDGKLSRNNNCLQGYSNRTLTCVFTAVALSMFPVGVTIGYFSQLNPAATEIEVAR